MGEAGLQCQFFLWVIKPMVCFWADVKIYIYIYKYINLILLRSLEERATVKHRGASQRDPANNASA